LDYHKFTVWVFPGKNKKFNGKLSLYEKGEGILILFGDVSLLDEFTDNRSMPGQEKIKKKHVCLWGTTPDFTLEDSITIEGFENHIHMENHVIINIKVHNWLRGHHVLRPTEEYQSGQTI
jgi:hypothetical protein